MPSWIVPLLTGLALVLGPILVYLATRQKTATDSKSQFDTNIIQYSGTQTERITALEASGAAKDRRIAELVDENYRLKADVFELRLQLKSQGVAIAELQEQIKRLITNNAGTTMTAAAGVMMTTTINPTKPQATSTGTPGVNEETGKVDITITEDPSAGDADPSESQPPKTPESNGKTRHKRIATKDGESKE